VERVPASSGEKPRLAGWIEGDSGTSVDHPTDSHAGESPAKSPALVAGPEDLTAEPSGAGGPVAVPAEASLDATAAQTAMADAEAAPATPSQEAGATQASPADQPIEDRVGGTGDGAVAMVEGPAESGPGIAFNALELDQSLPRPGSEAAANSPQTSVSVEAPEGADASVAINPADRADAGVPAAEPVEKGVASVQWSSGEGAAQVEARIEPRAAVVTPRSHRAPQNEFDILTYAPEVGTGASAEDMAALAMGSSAVSLQGRQKSRYETGEIKAQLMSGGWSVFGKPAVLLPSVINHCEDEGTQILCWTAPQDVDAGAKNLVYQAEATLDSFSRRGTFRVRYRIMETSMPLSETDLPQRKQVRVSPGWTALERETTCHIIHSSLIRCQGGAEGVFSYRRI